MLVGGASVALTLIPDLDDIASSKSGSRGFLRFGSGQGLVGGRGRQLKVSIDPVACRRRWIGSGSVGVWECKFWELGNSRGLDPLSLCCPPGEWQQSQLQATFGQRCRAFRQVTSQVIRYTPV